MNDTSPKRDPRRQPDVGDVFHKHGLKGGTYKVRAVGPRRGLVHLVRDDDRRIAKPMNEFIYWARNAKVIRAAD